MYIGKSRAIAALMGFWGLGLLAGPPSTLAVGRKLDMMRKKKEIFTALVLFCCLFVFRIAEGGINVWTAQGPAGAQISDLLVDPTKPSTLYVATDGVFKSTNAGNTWSGSGLSDLRFIENLTFDPFNSNILYAGTTHGVFQSTNGGSNWQARNNGLSHPNCLRALEVNALVVDPVMSPVMSTTLYLGTPDGCIFKSLDAGDKWTFLAKLSDKDISTLAIAPETPGTASAVYATTDGVLYKSDDGGPSWPPLSIPGDPLVDTVAVDPTTPTTLYASTADGDILKSVDGGGTSWTTIINELVEEDNINLLAVDPGNPNTVYAGTEANGLFKIESTDGGNTWTANSVNNGLTAIEVASLAFNPTNSNILYAGTNGGVFESKNGGRKWRESNRGLNAFQVIDLEITQVSPPILYAVMDGSGIYKSVRPNRGARWDAVNKGLPTPDVQALAIHPSDSSILYAGDEDGGIHQSTNGGDTWNTLSTLERKVTVLEIDPINPSTLYAGTVFHLFKSIDGGTNWTIIIDDLRLNALAIDPFNTNTLYAGAARIYHYDGGVFTSNDGGTSWSNEGLTGYDVAAVVIDPVTPSTVYAGTDGGVYKRSTINGDASWEQSGLLEYDVAAVAIEPDNPDTLYAGTVGGGVFKSTDGGIGWTAINEGLTDLDVLSLAIESINPATLTLYAGTRSGVFALTQRIR